MNSKLFDKSIDLKTNLFFGGGNGITWKECTETFVDENGCTNETTYTYNDKGELEEQCTKVTCPD